MTYQTIIAFIVGVLVGNLFGMLIMGLLVASRDRNDNAINFRSAGWSFKEDKDQ